MSLVFYVDVVCDRCRTQLDDGGWTGAQARETARADGWRVSLPGGRDLCPECRKAKSPGE